MNCLRKFENSLKFFLICFPFLPDNLAYGLIYNRYPILVFIDCFQRKWDKFSNFTPFFTISPLSMLMNHIKKEDKSKIKIINILYLINFSKIKMINLHKHFDHKRSLNITFLRDFTFTFHFHALEKEMATHSSVLAWRIPGTGEPGGLPSMGSHRVGHEWSDLAPAASERKTDIILYYTQETVMSEALEHFSWPLSWPVPSKAGDMEDKNGYWLL